MERELQQIQFTQRKGAALTPLRPAANRLAEEQIKTISGSPHSGPKVTS